MKLTYFNIRGLAENVRLILAQAGVDYEDKRVTKEEWAELKETMPFGQVPVLENDDGQMICQSIAIARFVAKENGLAGKDNWTQAQADMVVDSIMDLFYREIFPAFHADAEKKKEILAKVSAEAAPKTLKYLARLLEQRGGEHFAGNELTWADIVTANMLDFLGNLLTLDMEKDFPTLLAFKAKIFELPNIKKWIESRPVTEM